MYNSLATTAQHLYNAANSIKDISNEQSILFLEIAQAYLDLCPNIDFSEEELDKYKQLILEA